MFQLLINFIFTAAYPNYIENAPTNYPYEYDDYDKSRRPGYNYYYNQGVAPIEDYSQLKGKPDAKSYSPPAPSNTKYIPVVVHKKKKKRKAN